MIACVPVIRTAPTTVPSQNTMRTPSRATSSSQSAPITAAHACVLGEGNSWKNKDCQLEIMQRLRKTFAEIDGQFLKI